MNLQTSTSPVTVTSVVNPYTKMEVYREKKVQDRKQNEIVIVKALLRHLFATFRFKYSLNSSDDEKEGKESSSFSLPKIRFSQ